MARGKSKANLTLRPPDPAFAGSVRVLLVDEPITGEESLSATRPSISNLVPQMEWETTGRLRTKKSLLITIRSNPTLEFSDQRKTFLAPRAGHSCRLRTRAARKL